MWSGILILIVLSFAHGHSEGSDFLFEGKVLSIATKINIALLGFGSNSEDTLLRVDAKRLQTLLETAFSTHQVRMKLSQSNSSSPGLLTQKNHYVLLTTFNTMWNLWTNSIRMH
jgi:hypothetical protein